jgi:ATP-dependent Clp protease ATP-binding subunit ClpA
VKLLPTRHKATIVHSADQYFRLGAAQASRLGEPYIGSEHVLLGLASNSTGTAAVVLKRLGVSSRMIEAEIRRHPGAPPPTAIDRRALATLGIDLDQVRKRIDERFGEGALASTRRGCWPVEPALKRALAHAIDAAGRDVPADRHILAGLVMVTDSGAALLLRRLGIAQDVLLRAVREL